MKKLIYIFLLTMVSALTVVSCTEEQVEPSTTGTGTGGGTGGNSDPGKI